MVYTSVEWIALIFIIFVLLKIIIISINRNLWINKVTKKVLKKPHQYAFLMLILSLIVLWLLLQELTIVQIIAASTFITLLIGFGMLQYTKELETLITKVQKDKHLIKRSWVYIVLWLILLLWGLKEILM